MLKETSRRAWSDEQRRREIDKICSGFVSPSNANKRYYRALLECLFPPGAGVPGPVVTREDLRAAVEAVNPDYKDVFRRVRELQGEEGLHGLVKEGARYQLQHTAISAKREPRRPISKSLARKIALAQGSRCTVCGTAVSTNGGRIDVDHRVPRTRGGTSYEGNMQVLCTSCNVSKSTQCSGCSLDCNTCGWAFPERFRPVKLRTDIILRLNSIARDQNRGADELANDLMDSALRNMNHKT